MNVLKNWSEIASVTGQFLDLPLDHVGNRVSRYDKMRHEGRSYMMKEFNDSLKRNFTGSEEEELFTCPIPGVADDRTAGIEDGMFVIDRDEMKAIFDPVVRKIIHLVQQQVREVEKLEVGCDTRSFLWAIVG